jgi:chromosome condensin MukBEF complex kleisin-like MukF subunit
MIVRLAGEGQYHVSDDVSERLNELDSNALAALGANDEGELNRVLKQMRDLVRANGRRLATDDLSASDAVLPTSELTLEETRGYFSESGLVPDFEPDTR